MASVPGDEKMADQNLDYIQRLMKFGQQGTQVNQTTPFGSQNWTTDANGNRTLTSSYDPRITEDYYGSMASRGAGRDLYGATTADLMKKTGSGAYNTANVGGPGVQYGTTPSTLMTGFSRDGFQRIPGADDFQGNQQKVEDALYARSTARLDPQFAKAQKDMESTLRNQGFQAGEEGFNDVQSNLNNAKTDAYGQARNDAIAGGASTASQLLADALRIRGTQDAEGQQDYGNWNTAAGTNFAQRNQNVQTNNAARGQSVQEYGSNFSVPLAMQQAAQGGLGGTTPLPNFGASTTGLAQPSSPSFLDFTKTGATNAQANENRNTNIGSSVAAGLGSAAGSIINDIDWGSIFGL